MAACGRIFQSFTNMKPDEQRNSEPETYPYFMAHLPPKFVKKAEKELFETPENRKLRIEDVKQMIRNDDTMEEEWFSEDTILMYLRSRKFDVHKAYSSIKRMVAFIKKHREYFEPTDAKLMDDIIKTKIFQFLPKRDSDGCLIAVFKLRNWDPSKFTATEVIRCFEIMFLHALNEPMTQVNGIKCVYDFKCRLLKYLRYATPFYVYMLYQMLIECTPMRIKSVHAINPTLITKIGLSLVTTVCSEKLKKRIFIHDSSEEVLMHFQKNVLPAELDGTLTAEEESSLAWAKTFCIPDYVTAILEGTRTES